MRCAARIGLFLALSPLSCDRDATLHEALIGAWARKIEEPGREQSQTLTFESDGSCTRELDSVRQLSEDEAVKLGKTALSNHETHHCRWEVKDKKLVRRYESPSPYVMTEPIEIVNDELRISVSAKLETFKKVKRVSEGR